MKRTLRTTIAALALAIAGTAYAQEAPTTPDSLDQIRAEHIMISTDDYDATVAWYRDMLGFEVVHQWTVPELPGLKLGYIERNGFVIEIVETPEARSERQRPADLSEAMNDRGIGHLAFLVADVDAVAAVLKSRGAEFLVAPTSFPDSGRRLIFIFDNGGNILEFLTPLSAYEGRE
ncbi:MAG: VOC family protein [Pseudomonadota bacterium]